MLIAIVNQSTLVSGSDAASMTAAIAAQIQTDAAPASDKAPASVTFYSSDADVPANAYKIVITDTIANQPQGVLGYHTEAAGGILSGIVAAKPELDTAALDKLGLIQQPFGILKTGYVVYSQAGKEQQKYGDEMPEWRKEMKKSEFARTCRLITQAQAFGS